MGRNGIYIWILVYTHVYSTAWTPAYDVTDGGTITFQLQSKCQTKAAHYQEIWKRLRPDMHIKFKCKLGMSA